MYNEDPLSDSVIVVQSSVKVSQLCPEYFPIFTPRDSLLQLLGWLLTVNWSYLDLGYHFFVLDFYVWHKIDVI